MKNTITKLDHVNFTVSNFNESVDWYRKIFNYYLVEKGVDRDGHKWGILKSGDTMLAITEFPGRKRYLGEDYHKTYHFGLRVVDQVEWEDKLEKYNLETHYLSPINYPNSTSWYVKDPTGNEIEVAIWNNDEVVFSHQGGL